MLESERQECLAGTPAIPTPSPKEGLEVMPDTTSRRPFIWAEGEAADAFVARAEEWNLSPEEMRAIARLADDTDEAVTILEFITDLRRPASER